MEEGKLSLDLLVGLSIFLIVFIFVANFLPEVFADVRNEITLAHETYKVTVVLAETKGYWKNVESNGTDWEKHQVCSKDYVFVPGLSKGQPDHLSFEKVKNFSKTCNQCIEKCKKALGLDVSNVRFRISLESLQSKPYDRALIRYFGTPLLDVGDPLPSSGNVFRFERFVWLDPTPGLTGVLILQQPKQGRAYPTQICEVISQGGEQTVECKLNFTYPFTDFTVKVTENLKGASSINFCINKYSNCPPRFNDVVEVRIYKDNKIQNGTSKSIEVGKLEDFLDFVNRELEKIGIKEGDLIHVTFSYKNLEAEVNIKDKFMAEYIAGKAVVKLVVYGW
ncbi:MAG: hypothetical protein NZ895_06485 [Archaeoglobaceae archaeon]|nr:hypothetical protein [Archaeoglobaceae archaeon]MCX8152298.1 hypothetical protein [Archaeoglobaceae archaeon]MDW8013976.1 hypothetical protein [Archaeoglobaceae archaeon]